jgi:hypothetical protein
MQNIKSVITNFLTIISEDPVEIFAKVIIRVSGFAAMTFVGALVVRAALLMIHFAWNIVTAPM